MDTLKLIKINSQSIEFNTYKAILAYEIFCETTQCTLNPLIKRPFKGPFEIILCIEPYLDSNV